MFAYTVVLPWKSVIGPKGIYSR